MGIGVLRRYHDRADTENVSVPVGPGEKVTETTSGDSLAGAQLPEKTEQSERPNEDDKKAVWESYAETRGVKTDGLTKQEIIDATK